MIVIAVYFFVVSLFFHFISKDKPQTPVNYINKNREAIYSALNNKELNKTKEGKKLVSFYQKFSCKFLGEACTKNPNDGDIYYKKSVVGMLSQLIVLPYKNPPASGIYWAYSGLQNAGFIPKTYAAEGLGFASLKPLQNLWKAFRDIAYMVLVLVLIAIGFMIMFRMKLNPQTVISVENALPKIVIALILITFSFAIAGFLIDLMYIMITLGIAAIGNRGNLYNVTEMQNKYLNAPFNEIVGSMFPYQNNATLPIIGNNTGNTVAGGIASMMALGQAFTNLLPDFINQVLRSAVAVVFLIVIFKPFIWNPIVDVSRELSNAFGGVGAVISVIIDIIVLIVFPLTGLAIGYSLLPIVLAALISITVLALFFRIFFLLLATYLKVLLLVVFSPIFMLFEAIPGKSAFSYWLKQLFAEIITFPVIILIFLVTYVIVNTPATVGALWQPPFLTDINPNAFTLLLGFAIMFQAPDFVKLVKEMLGVKDMPFGLNLGTFFGGAAGVGGTGLGLLGQVGSINLGLQALTGGRGLDIQKMLHGQGILADKKS